MANGALAIRPWIPRPVAWAIWFAGAGLVLQALGLRVIGIAVGNLFLQGSLWTGLLLIGAALVARLTDSEAGTPIRSPLAAWGARIAALTLLGVAAAASIGLIGSFAFAFFGDPLGIVADDATLFERFAQAFADYPKPSAAILVWLTLAPACACGGIRLFHAAGCDDSNSNVEQSTLLASSGWLLVAAIGANYDPNDPLVWDSMRLLFRVGAIVCSFGAALPALAPRPRRWAISWIVLVHFSAISTATMAVPPSSNAVNQLWIRVFRPYLEFMYMNNAYHFYSPEPGPPTHLWLRMIYDTGKEGPADEDGKPTAVYEATWLKLPDVDANGNHQYPVSLVYQRILAITENAASNDSAPPLFVSPGQIPAPFYRARLEHSPLGVGVLGVRAVPSIPFHTEVAESQQYTPPTLSSNLLLKSYAKHAGRIPPPQPGWKFHSVKIYRVLHVLPPIKKIVDGFEGNNPLFYRPSYAGQYDANGELLDKDSPFLYWMLPILRDDRTRFDSRIRNWALFHAGDPRWVMEPGSKEWTEPKPLPETKLVPVPK